MKNKNIFKKILCAALCLCMICGTLLAFNSCNKEEAAPTEPTEEVISVVKVVADIAEGTKITADMLTTVETKVSNVPLNAIRDAAKIEGKFAAQKLYAGEYVFAGKLTTVDREQNIAEIGPSHLVITDKITNSGDVADAIQKVIDENPGRTIDFPDGTYTVSKPIKVPTDPAKAVSLRLSDFAVIKATDSFAGDAVVCLSVGAMPEGGSLTNTFYFQGGTIDGNGKAKGMYVENAENLLVSNVGFKNVSTGIEVKAGVLDVENVNIVCNGAADSVGMVIAGKNSTYINVRIHKAETGVKVSGDNNLLKSVYATYSGTSNTSVAFLDSSKGCNYDMCTSEQYAIGFSLEAQTVSVYSGCYSKWESDAITTQWAYRAVGKFNGVIRACRADFDFAECDGTFLEVGAAEGKGQVLYPMIGGKDNMADNTFESYLAETSVIYR